MHNVADRLGPQSGGCLRPRNPHDHDVDPKLGNETLDERLVRVVANVQRNENRGDSGDLGADLGIGDSGHAGPDPVAHLVDGFSFDAACPEVDGEIGGEVFVQNEAWSHRRR
jgi:hypothetical protein